MRRLVQVALFVLLAASFTFAQRTVTGAPASVTSPRTGVNIVPVRPVPAGQPTFGPPASIFSPQPGKPFGPPPSVTSLGPTGYTFAPCVLGNCGRFRHGFRHNFGFQGFVASYPVVIPIFATPEVQLVPLDEAGSMLGAEPQQNEIVGTQGGGSSIMYSGQRHVTMAAPVGTRSYDDERPARSARSRDESEDEARDEIAAAPKPEPPAQPPAPQETTVLVFKDGHKLEVTNYAIQGHTLFNFSGNGPRQIAISELDVKATTKANDDNGVQFRLP